MFASHGQFLSVAPLTELKKLSVVSVSCPCCHDSWCVHVLPACPPFPARQAEGKKKTFQQLVLFFRTQFQSNSHVFKPKEAFILTTVFLSLFYQYGKKNFSKIAVVLFCANVSNVDLFKIFDIDFGMLFLLLLVVFLLSYFSELDIF